MKQLLFTQEKREDGERVDTQGGQEAAPSAAVSNLLLGVSIAATKCSTLDPGQGLSVYVKLICKWR